MSNINDQDFNARLEIGQVTSDNLVGSIGDLNDQQRQLLDRNDALKASSAALYAAPDSAPANSELRHYAGPFKPLSPEDLAAQVKRKEKSALKSRVRKYDVPMIIGFYILSFALFAFSSRNTSAANDYLGMAFVSFFSAGILFLTVGLAFRFMYRRHLRRNG